MKFIHTQFGIFGLSKLETGRHWVCMSCRNVDKDTLTPMQEYEDGDHEPDGDSLCAECARKEVTKRRPGLDKWIRLSVEEVEKVLEAMK